MSEYRAVYLGLVSGPRPGQMFHGWAVKNGIDNFASLIMRTEKEAKTEASRLNALPAEQAWA